MCEKTASNKINRGRLQSCPAEPGTMRRRIWNIDPSLFCSVCGTCLGLEEQRTLLNKLRIDNQNFSDHEVHAFMVRSLHSDNKVSRRLERLLNNKYRSIVSAYGNCYEKHFMQVWKEHMQTGDICGLYWAAVANCSLSEGAVWRIFCDVHMLSHLNGGQARKEKALCESLQQSNAELKIRAKEEKGYRKELRLELDRSRQRHCFLEKRLRELEQAAGSEAEPAEAAANPGRELYSALARVRQLEEEISELQERAREQMEINAVLDQELRSLLEARSCEIANCQPENCWFRGRNCEKREQAGEGAGAEEACGRAGAGILGDKRVLIVGGITKLKSFYREAVENLGGDFSYHDGYLRSGERELESLVARSDIILCPVDCNSHNACLSVKKICSRTNKPCQFLPSSSLSSIAGALTAAAGSLSA